jgi:P27 family predicted phage terminase small subunit
MANQRQPIELIQYKGKKHLTKAEIAERRSSQVEAPDDDIRPPEYLNKKQKAEFDYLSMELARMGLFGNVDAGILARYCVAHSLYGRYTKLLRTAPKKKAKRMRELAEANGTAGELAGLTDEELALELESDLTILQNRFFAQCDQCAKAMGLSITSRCRLVIPAAPEAPKENKFARFEKQA